MNASQFIKQYGWEKAKEVVSLAISESWADHYNISEDSIGTAGTIYSKMLCERNNNFVCLRDLKQLVDAWDLVQKCGGLSEAKAIEQQYWNSGVGFAMAVAMELKQAIELMESVK